MTNPIKPNDPILNFYSKVKETKITPRKKDRFIAIFITTYFESCRKEAIQLASRNKEKTTGE